MTPLPSHIGPYEIVQPLGKGGMAVVYLARDAAIDRLVAIKLLRESLDDPELRERFSREARSAGRLRHQNIVTVFQVGVHESTPYIVMEYIPGDSLAAVIARQPPVSLAWKLRVIEDLCRGLAYAHKSGVIHRDMKPANVQIDSDGMVKILDFGIARIGEPKAGEPALTQLGMMMGTPNYMSPEQINPGTADHRSDVFAVGLVLYELLTYRRAFSNDSYAVLHSILHEAPEPVERLCPGIDPDVVAILDRALKKDPDARYQDLAEMRDDLRRVRLRLRSAQDTSDEGPVPPVARVSSDEEATRLADRGTETRRLFSEAREAFEAGELDAAIQRCERVLALETSHPEAIDLRARARSHLALARARELLAAGQAAFAAGQFDKAAEHIRQAEALALSGDEGATLHAQLTALAHAVATAAERARAMSDRLARARELVNRASLEAAAQAVDEALAIAPGHREALAVRAEVRAAIEGERARQLAAEEAVAEARRHAGRADFDRAIALLEHHRPAHPAVTAALADIHEQRKAAERAADERRQQQAAEKAVVEARRYAARGDFARAIALLEPNLQYQVATAALADIQEQRTAAERAAEERGLKEAAKKAAAEARRHAGRGDFASAIALLEQHRPEHPLVTAALAEIQDQRKAAERAAEERRIEEAAEKVAREARRHAGRGDFASAIALLEQHRPEHPVVTAALVEIQDQRKAAEERRIEEAAEKVAREARRHAGRGDFVSALALLERHRPEHPVVTAALAEIQDQRKAAEERRRREYAARAEALLLGGRDRWMEDPTTVLADLRTIEFGSADLASPALDRLQPEINSLIGRCEASHHLQTARAALAAGDLTAASEAVDRARQRDRAHPESAAVLAAVARAKTIRDVVRRARKQLKQGNLEVAVHSIDEALALAPDSREVLEAQAELRKAVAERDAARERAAEAAVNEARQHAARGDFDSAITVLRHQGYEHPMVTAARTEVAGQQLAAEQREASERRRQEYTAKAQAILRTARASADHLPAAALRQLRAIQFGVENLRSPALEQLRPEVDALMARCEAAQQLEAARTAMASGDLRAASEALDRARRFDPTHPDMDDVAGEISATIVMRPEPSPVPPVAPTVFLPRKTWPPAEESHGQIEHTHHSEFAPEPAPAPQPTRIAAKPPASVHESAASRTGILVTAGAVAAVLLLAIGWWWTRTDEGQPPASQIAQGNVPPVEAPAPTAAAPSPPVESPAPSTPPPSVTPTAPPPAAGTTRGNDARPPATSEARTPAPQPAPAPIATPERQAPPPESQTAPPVRPTPPPAAPADTPAPVPPPSTPAPTPARRPAEPPVETPVPPPAPDLQAEAARDTAAIREALAQFASGYQRLDANAVRRVWPGAPASLQQSFAAARSYQVLLENPQITLRGDTATVTTLRRIRVQPEAGRLQETSIPTTFVLRRAGAGWLVDRIQ